MSKRKHILTYIFGIRKAQRSTKSVDGVPSGAVIGMLMGFEVLARSMGWVKASPSALDGDKILVS